LALRLMPIVDEVDVRLDEHLSETQKRTWQTLAADWRLWLCIAACLLVGTIAWLLGYG
jgi:hypothetical protein